MLTRNHEVIRFDSFFALLEHFSEYFRIVTDCYIFENLTSNHEKVELILAIVQQDSTWKIDRRDLEVQYIWTLTIIIMYPPILFLVIDIKTWVILWKLATLKTYITIDSRLKAFSRVSCRLQVLALSCDWLIWMSATITIGSTNITWGILHCRNFPAIWLSRALRKLSPGRLAMKAGKRLH